MAKVKKAKKKATAKKTTAEKRNLTVKKRTSAAPNKPPLKKKTTAGRKPPNIMVADDVCVDWFQVSREGKHSASTNWLSFPKTQKFCQGGALLLASIVKKAVGEKATICRQNLPNMAKISHEEVVHYHRELAQFPALKTSNAEGKVTRAKRVLTFSG